MKIIESPTGSGKSAWAAASASFVDSPDPRQSGLSHDNWRPHQLETLRWLVDDPGSVIVLTRTKSLQMQYGDGYNAAVLFGRANYDCLLDVEPGLDDVKEAEKALDAATDVSPGTCNASLAPCKYAKGFTCTKKNPMKEGLSVMDFEVDADSLCDYYGALTKAQQSMYFVGNTAYLMGMNRSGKVLPNQEK